MHSVAVTVLRAPKIKCFSEHREARTEGPLSKARVSFPEGVPNRFVH
jgi:hypothetical protein